MFKSPHQTLTYVFQSKKLAKAQKNIPLQELVTLNALNRALTHSPSVPTLFL